MQGRYSYSYTLYASNIPRTEADDLVARAANIQQVANYIDTWSIGNSVIVFGDTNSRYTRVADKITVFQTQSGLIDPFVQLMRGGVNPTVETLCDNPSLINTCETVDKVFYRGSKQLKLEATYFNYESSKFEQADGSILSDQ